MSQRKWTFFAFTFLCLIMHCAYSAAYASDNAIDTLLHETTSYFRPMQGKILSVEGQNVTVNIGRQNSVKPGMRFQVFREELPFRHPVTRELIGNLESLTGRLQITEVKEDTSTGEMIEGSAREGDIVRISEMKINLLFCQSSTTDWQIAESLFRALRGSGRFQVIETSLETDNAEEAIREARRLNAEVTLHLRSKSTENATLLMQDLYWASDGLKIVSLEKNIDETFARETPFAEKFFAFDKHQPLTRFDLPSAVQLLIICDVDGDRKKDFVFSTGAELIVYSLDRNLHPALGGIAVKGSTRDRHIWIDSIDLNRNGRDEVIVTSMQDGEVVSYLYEYDGNGFILLHRENLFMRNAEGKLVGQMYSHYTGFSGEVFDLYWDGELKKGNALKLPNNVNIYDFIVFEDTTAGNLFLAYDENGYLSVYNERTMQLWKSASGVDYLTTFSKSSPSAMLDRGKWSVKDRLLTRQRAILYVKRIPFLDIVKGLGFKKSQIRSLQWNGYSMDDRVIIDGVDGTILDYAVAGDNIYILASPPFGVRTGNILTGENLFRKELSVHSLKGK